MLPVDPRVDPKLVPPGSKAIVVAEHQDRYIDLPSVVTPHGVVITRWALTEDDRMAILRGADIYLTIWGTPIRPVHLNVGPCDWSEL